MEPEAANCKSDCYTQKYSSKAGVQQKRANNDSFFPLYKTYLPTYGVRQNISRFLNLYKGY